MTHKCWCVVVVGERVISRLAISIVALRCSPLGGGVTTRYFYPERMLQLPFPVLNPSSVHHVPKCYLCRPLHTVGGSQRPGFSPRLPVVAKPNCKVAKRMPPNLTITTYLPCNVVTTTLPVREIKNKMMPFIIIMPGYTTPCDKGISREHYQNRKDGERQYVKYKKKVARSFPTFSLPSFLNNRKHLAQTPREYRLRQDPASVTSVFFEHQQQTTFGDHSQIGPCIQILLLISKQRITRDPHHKVSISHLAQLLFIT